ncbi:T9SS type A sorting domain-containing protein [Polaribacter glomeratus]|uniref:Secretion system C-terminal sorting domain-containing protein n=1 Tax=Polaribacter glomeratus TaxID=102 RepID=A0A2S7WUZ9_9FLAO|nr:T9SS type A sorting domain-containing protein [Polaribacter glomeratus]PQJ81161.1 hypothetical protein BTO16_00520 [Polaribacter glomeratus]TXD65715.1 T9SS type A sorting domain-containing protein [Polaribacter glomeratus]
MRKTVLILFLLLTFLSVPAQTASGDIENYAESIINAMPGSSTNTYIQPTTANLATWESIINFILSDKLTDARALAGPINYQVTEFTDTSLNPNKTFYILEEKAVQNRYWGTYIFNKNPVRNNLIIAAPHSKFDTNTGNQAVYCFKNTLAKAVFINGTHRCNSFTSSNCSGTTNVCGSTSNYKISDQAHATSSMFQKTTEVLYNSLSTAVFVQLHGFTKQSNDPYVIMSNGTNKTPTIDYAVQIKNALLNEDSSLTFKLAHIDTDWTRLTAFTNTQGRYINNSSNACSTDATATSGRFIHIEQEKEKLRDSANDWRKMSNALKSVFTSTLGLEENLLDTNITVYPNPTSNTLEIKATKIKSVELINVLGKSMRIYRTNELKNTLQINIEDLAKSMYFLKINTATSSVIRKIIKN